MAETDATTVAPAADDDGNVVEAPREAAENWAFGIEEDPTQSPWHQPLVPDFNCTGDVASLLLQMNMLHPLSVVNREQSREQMHALGAKAQALLDRFSNFLPRKYNDTDIHLARKGIDIGIEAFRVWHESFSTTDASIDSVSEFLSRAVLFACKINMLSNRPLLSCTEYVTLQVDALKILYAEFCDPSFAKYCDEQLLEDFRATVSTPFPSLKQHMNLIFAYYLSSGQPEGITDPVDKETFTRYNDFAKAILRVRLEVSEQIGDAFQAALDALDKFLR